MVAVVTGGDQHGQQQDGGQRGAVRDGADRHGHQVGERPARESHATFISPNFGQGAPTSHDTLPIRLLKGVGALPSQEDPENQH